MTDERLNELKKLYLENADSLDASSYGVLELIAEIRRMKAANAALCEDKARIDWMDEHGGGVKNVWPDKPEWIIYRYPLHKQKRHATLREAIDAARSSS